MTILRRVLALVLASVLILVLGLQSYTALVEWGERAVVLDAAQVVDFPRGTGLKALADELGRRGVVDRPLRFLLWVRFFSDYSRFQAGLYRFEGAVSPAQAASKILRGEIHIPVVLQFTIPEGFTARATFARLVELGVSPSAEFEVLMGDEAFLKELRIPGPTLEGYLYPATYRFAKMPSSREVIEAAVRTFWRKLPAEYELRAVKMGLSLHEAVTLASLIELETPHDEERRLVSEVIWRRLKKGAPLGVDAALIYGIEDYRGNITREHLNDARNRYNTRIHKGLPPTPIGSPALASLEAALEPANEGYYYYVLDAGTDRRHHFSKTLAEHNSHVQKLIAAQKARRGQEREEGL